MIDIGRICLEMGRFFSILIISKQYRCVDLISCFEVCKYLWLEERMIALKRLVAFWIDYFIILILLIFLMPLVVGVNNMMLWCKTAFLHPGYWQMVSKIFKDWKVCVVVKRRFNNENERWRHYSSCWNWRDSAQ